MAKATESRDGRMRVTVRVSHRMDLWQAGEVLVMAYRDWTPDDPDEPSPDPDAVVPLPPELSAARADDKIRDQLWEMGQIREGWADHMDDGEQTAWTQWAHRQVLKVWPGLATGQEKQG